MQNPQSLTEPVARRVLQMATRQVHERLHANVAFAGLLRGDMTRQGYQRLLVCLLGLHGPIEVSLERVAGDPLLAWRRPGHAPSRAALLRSDLRALGLGARDIAAVPRADGLLPIFSGLESALGCAWVVEGSALGGRVMSTQVDAIPELPPNGSGRAFFASDPGQPARWDGCCEAVEACGAQPDSLLAMTRSAVKTFKAFESWLDTHG